MKKRDIWILAAVTAVILTISSLSILTAQSIVTWEGILPGISSELGGTYAINIANTASTVGFDVSEETALTNTVNGTFKSTHTTTGTPAINIGNGNWFYQETTAGNTEKIMELNAVVTDETAATEDAKFSVELMAAGAASAQKFAVESDGVLTLVNDETIDNTVNGTITYTATTHALAGAATVSGTLGVTGILTAVDIIANGWSYYAPETVTAQSYTISSSGKALTYIVEVTDTEAARIDLPDTPTDGLIIIVTDGDQNASANNLIVETEGSDTIDEAANFTQDADGESTWFQYDAGNTDWKIIGGYLE
jgi:hypothetical protein